MNKPLLALLSLAVGGALGAVSTQYLPYFSHDMSGTTQAVSDPNEPLYWVAPMDPNYQRDKPGKSPMGMDLIPVYAEDLAGGNDKPGTVKIDPAVENNLGVKSQQVELDFLTPVIETVGYVNFDESQLWQTNVRVSGWIESLKVNTVGEYVSKGDVLFTIYSPELVKAQEELLSAHRSKRQGLIKGATDRLRTLGMDSGQIRAMLKRGKAQQNIAVVAPASGIIAALNIRDGSYVTPATNTISAGPIDKVWVDAEVFERDSHWLEKGTPAEMKLDGLPGKSWQGEVDYIYPILDAATRTLRVRLVFDNQEAQLKPNMFANLSLTPQSDAESLLIPTSSVIRTGGITRVVLAEGEGKYRSARIEVGREAEERIEVIEGLTKDDRVVTSAHFMIDSESSQSADFSRINGVEPEAGTAWAKGEITDVMLDHRMLTINHEPVPEWDWPGMTMNFNFAPDVELPQMEAGQNIDFEIRENDAGQYEIVDFTLGDIAVVPEVWVDGSITMLMVDFGMVTFAHEASTELNWDSGEMNFTIEGDIDLTRFSEQQAVQFLVTKKGSEFVLLDIKEQN